MAAPAHEHEQKLTVSIDVYVPDHPDRSESPVFRKARKLLIEDNPDAKCWIDNGQCEGGLELHHDLVEWCDAEGIDWDKMRRLYPDFDWSTFKEPADFIDSAYNARRVLCKKHHTGKDHGLHYLPGPIYLMQKHKRVDFIFAPDERPE